MSKVLAIGPRAQRVYSSLRAASRVFSGDGSDRRRSLIANYVENGGGRIRRTWIQKPGVRSVKRSTRR